MSDSDWIHGVDEKTGSPTMKLTEAAYKKAMWFMDPLAYFTSLGFGLSTQAADALQQFAEDDLNAYYWLHVAADEHKEHAGSLVKWMVTLLREVMNERGKNRIGELRLNPQDFTKLVLAVEGGKITRTMGKEALRRLCDHENIETILADPAYQVIDLSTSIPADIAKIMDDLVSANATQVADFKGGNAKVLDWFVGQVMRATKGKVQAGIVKMELQNRLQAA